MLSSTLFRLGSRGLFPVFHCFVFFLRVVFFLCLGSTGRYLCGEVPPAPLFSLLGLFFQVGARCRCHGRMPAFIPLFQTLDSCHDRVFSHRSRPFLFPLRWCQDAPPGNGVVIDGCFISPGQLLHFSLSFARALWSSPPNLPLLIRGPAEPSSPPRLRGHVTTFVVPPSFFFRFFFGQCFSEER